MASGHTYTHALKVISINQARAPGLKIVVEANLDGSHLLCIISYGIYSINAVLVYITLLLRLLLIDIRK